MRLECTLFVGKRPDVSIATILPKFKDTIPITHYRKIKLGESGLKWRQTSWHIGCQDSTCKVEQVCVGSGGALWPAPFTVGHRTRKPSLNPSSGELEHLSIQKASTHWGWWYHCCPGSTLVVLLPGPAMQSLYLGPILRAGLRHSGVEQQQGK